MTTPRAPLEPSGVINERLRDYVQQAAFTFNLGRTHIAALVWLDLTLKNNNIDSVLTPRGIGNSIWSNYSTGSAGLQRRGLVIHHHRPRKDRHGRWVPQRPRQIWTITRAGRLVIGLLKETGLYDEYANQLIVRVEKIA